MDSAQGQAGGQGKNENLFAFSASIAWGVWPVDDKSWDSLFKGTYELLMETWKAGEGRIARYNKEPPA
jgi:hypothetical protein